MLGHIYSVEVNKIWPVSSKTELLHILAVFVLLKGLAGSAEKILLRQAGGGRGVCCGSVEWKVVWKRVAAKARAGVLPRLCEDHGCIFFKILTFFIEKKNKVSRNL